MKLVFNLLEERKKDYKKLWAWFFFLLFAVIALVLPVYYNYQLSLELKNKLAVYQVQQHSAQKEKENFLRTVKSASQPPPDITELQEKAAFVNRFYQERRFYWTEFLNHLEKEVPADIMLTNITPDPNSDKVIVEGLAKTPQNIVNFLEKLQSVPQFQEVFLTQQEQYNYKIGNTDRHEIVERFSLSFNYQRKVF